MMIVKRQMRLINHGRCDTRASVIITGYRLSQNRSISDGDMY